MSTFLPTSGFTWVDPMVFHLNKYTSSSSKVCVSEVDLEYPEKSKEKCCLVINYISLIFIIFLLVMFKK